MGWRGALRSLAATSRRIERDQQRRQRDAHRAQQLQTRLEAVQQAADAVEAYEDHVALFTAAHTECSEAWDWHEIQNTPPPAAPKRSNEIETSQRERELLRQPRIIDKLFGWAEDKRRASEHAIEEAVAADDLRYQKALKDYEEKCKDWQELQQVATGVLAGETTAFAEALKELNPFQDLGSIGGSLKMNLWEWSAEVTLFLHPRSRMPTASYSLLKTGRISTKKLSTAAINEFYWKHICSAVFRVTRELFARLPFERVFVHGTCEMLSSQTGNLEQQVVISLMIPKATFDRLNFELLDPVDAIENFVHRKDFSKIKGISSVVKLNPDE